MLKSKLLSAVAECAPDLIWMLMRLFSKMCRNGPIPDKIIAVRNIKI